MGVSATVVPGRPRGGLLRGLRLFLAREEDLTARRGIAFPSLLRPGSDCLLEFLLQGHVFVSRLHDAQPPPEHRRQKKRDTEPEA